MRFILFKAIALQIHIYFSLDIVPGRVRVAVRLRPRNAEELASDADFADCVELQPEVLMILYPSAFSTLFD